MKKIRYWLLFYSIFTLSLTGCSSVKKLSAGVTKLITPPHIAKLTPSLVLITHGKREGNGTGFFVAGEKNVCTVLTTRHVIGMSSQVQLQTHDLKVWGANKVRLFPNHDLALVMFDFGSQGCPYKALELGNSDSFKVGDNAYIFGFAKEINSEKITQQFASSRVLIKQDVTDGYAISYTAMTAEGMSGSPVFDKIGKVVAVQGLSGAEVSFIMAFRPGGKLSQKPPSGVNINFDKLGGETPDSKWAIPINTYLANVHKLPASDVSSTQSAKEWVKIGNDFQTYRLEEDSLAAYDKAIQIKSDFADAWDGRGGALFNLQRYEAAVAAYDKAIQIKSGFAQAWFFRGLALYHLKRYEDAIASYDKAIQIKPDYRSVWFFRGNALYDLKRYKDAVASYDKAIQVNPNNGMAWFKRGNALSDLKRYEDAVASYDKVIQVDSGFSQTAWFKRGNALSDLKRYEDAVASYDKAIKLRLNDADAWYNQGLALSKLKRYKQAVASYDKAIQIKSDFANAWYNRGGVLSDLKRYGDAVASYDKAIQIKPDFADAWFFRGGVLYDLKRYKDAVASYDKAIQIQPNDADAWFGRSIVLVLLGRNQEALESVEKGLKINPNVQYAQELRKTILQQLGR
ncbi:tetratricopeptide repeat-containing serine protease family protein [Microcoleus sp. FACHB-672]|uniref:tetratricopeptide repeat-containing S1 family peptidase n=1 Tax=Microcoleus sp. FACHB-672 TaxID=2692825 RepID=UPI001685A2A0|nr:tetratricopeptide repeat protein [Microcoleus sp. FACHB-672]MBD2039408.1 tetratricopeptide repeat protein [Microcoleus sp. FACHB-672]